MRQTGFTHLRFVVLNNSGHAWIEFEFELQEIKDRAEHVRRRAVLRPAPLRERATSAPTASPSSAATSSPTTGCCFRNGKVDPLARASSFSFLVTDFTPRWQFYIVQDPRIPSSVSRHLASAAQQIPPRFESRLTARHSRTAANSTPRPASTRRSRRRPVDRFAEFAARSRAARAAPSRGRTRRAGPSRRRPTLAPGLRHGRQRPAAMPRRRRRRCPTSGQVALAREAGARAPRRSTSCAQAWPASTAAT